MSLDYTTPKFIIMWSQEGLECIIPIDDSQRLQDCVNVLAGEKVKSYEERIGQTLHYMEMRARFNPQRYYEIYLLTTTDGIGEKEIQEMFDDSPQGAVDIIREKGTRLYGERANKRAVIY